jgi:sigma-E factor negative regulatory protein RseA
MDDGLDPARRGEVLAEALGNGEMRAAWTRYHLIGDALRGELASSEAVSVADRVRAALADDPVPLVTRTGSQRPRWVAPAAGFALAASVAALAIVAGPGLLDQGSGVAPVTDGASLAKEDQPPTVLYLNTAGTGWNLPRPELESRLNHYLINHQEYAPASGMKGMLPYAAYASYDLRR